MSYYKIKTSKNSYKFINKDKIVNTIFNYMVGILATYGFIELILHSNGL